ncbi:hypothetical protein KP509_01G095100 [Ceratopteris richardii]|uniref:Uncharacterized protein n=1 Tax=Ceratopteris richardii TaxID=49495 RepID=A0A8T2VRX7_CERRI|nr:hypothetical protein KP509_01G095100 [Ceratopteris richardii]
MQSFLAGDGEIKGEQKTHHDGGTCVVVEKYLTDAPSVPLYLDQNSSDRELDEVPEDALGKCRLECLQHTTNPVFGKAQMSNGSFERSPSNLISRQLVDPVYDEGCKDLELDKNLPPIKTRRDGDPREHSPSDLSPPSPKRLRQGYKENEEKWNAFGI